MQQQDFPPIVRLDWDTTLWISADPRSKATLLAVLQDFVQRFALSGLLGH